MTQTLMEKFGFKDNELGTPEHDALCIKLLNEDVQKRIIKARNPHMSLDTVKSIKILLEQPIITRSYSSRCVIGFIDAIMTFYHMERQIIIPIECKIKIEFGSLLRQINFYREGFFDGEITNEKYVTKFFKDTHPIIFTNDLKYKKELETQGLIVVTADIE